MPPASDANRTPVVVADVDRRGRGLEQARLRPVVVLHVGVEVEVILGQVGKGRGGEPHARHPFERQRVRRHLHHACPIAGVHHPPQRRLQVDALGCGAFDRLHHAPDPLLDGSQESRRPAGGRQHRVDEERRRGLAVGARDPHQLEGTAGVAVERVGRCGHRHPRRADRAAAAPAGRGDARRSAPPHRARPPAPQSRVHRCAAPARTRAAHPGHAIGSIRDRPDLRIPFPEPAQRPDRTRSALPASSAKGS